MFRHVVVEVSVVVGSPHQVSCIFSGLIAVLPYVERTGMRDLGGTAAGHIGRKMCVARVWHLWT